MAYPITDWDDAYANGPHIPNGMAYPGPWLAPAQAYRDDMTRQGRARLDLAYGPGARNRLDLFAPSGKPRGLLVFVHGGFWKALDKSVWSHFAQGAVEAGWSVAVPSYTLCPQARISQITREIAAAIGFAAGEVGGDIALAGHSAGGQLVTRMICEPSPLAAPVLARVRRVTSISGVHDLRPLLRTGMNADLRLDWDEARSESPALLAPLPGQTLTCWVGADERPEFLRQNSVMAQMWMGFDTQVRCMVEPGRHHFNVIEGLRETGHPLLAAVLGA